MPKKSDELRAPTQAVGFQLRFQERLRARLEEAAKEGGTSLNSEIVGRLHQSVADDDLYGGAANKRLLIELSAQFTRAETLTGKPWLNDPKTFGAVRELVSRWINERRPPARNASGIEAAKEKLRTSEAKLTGAIIHLEEAGVIRKVEAGGVRDLLLGSTRGLWGGSGRLMGIAQSRPTGLPAAYSSVALRTPDTPLLSEEGEQRQALNRLLMPYRYELAVQTFDCAEWDLTVPAAEQAILRGYLDLLPAWIETVNEDRRTFLDAWAEDEAEVKAGIALAQPQEAPEDVHGA